MRGELQWIETGMTVGWILNNDFGRSDSECVTTESVYYAIASGRIANGRNYVEQNADPHGDDVGTRKYFKIEKANNHYLAYHGNGLTYVLTRDFNFGDFHRGLSVDYGVEGSVSPVTQYSTIPNVKFNNAQYKIGNVWKDIDSLTATSINDENNGYKSQFCFPGYMVAGAVTELSCRVNIVPNTPPVHTTPNSFTTTGTPIIIPLGATDADKDYLKFILTSHPTNSDGQGKLDHVSINQPISNEQLLFTPVTAGISSFSYTVTDGRTGHAVSNTITIDIESLDDLSSSDIFYEAFESGFGNWLVVNDDDGDTHSYDFWMTGTDGQPSSIDGKYAHIRDCDTGCTMTMRNSVDISDIASPRLEADIWVDGIRERDGDYYNLEIFYNDNWITLDSYTRDNIKNGVWHKYSKDLSTYKSDDFKFRLNVQGEGPTDYHSIDNIRIYDFVQTAPAVITDLLSTPTVTSNTLTWSTPNDGNSDITSYKIQKAINGPFRYTTIERNYGSATTTSYVDTSVISGTTYYYKISARNDQGIANESRYASATIPYPQTAPTISSISDITLSETDTAIVTVTVSDVNRDVDTITFTGLPSFVTIEGTTQNTSTLLISPNLESSGIYNIVATATDLGGRFDTEQFRLTVTDFIPLVFTSTQNDITQIIDSGNSAIVQFDLPTANKGIVTCNPLSGSSFDIGSTIITCTATSEGRSSTTSFNVIVQLSPDVTPPILTIPGDKTFEATAVLTSLTDSQIGVPTVTDDRNPTPTVTSNTPSSFPLGDTIITYTTTDDSRNIATATQTITIRDTTPPTITAPANITLESTGMLSMLVLGNPTVSDLVDPTPTVTSNAPTSFPLGDTIITYTATDDYGNSATATQRITIQDTISPTIILPADITAEATGVLTVLDIGTTSTTSNVDYTITNDAPTSFPLGTTIVTWRVSDSSGNAISDTQRIIITDTTPPTITAPANITLEATGMLSMITLGNPAVSDLVDSTPTVISNAPASYPVGTYDFTYIAIDYSGNIAIDTQTITIRDTTPPTITAPANITLEATGMLSMLTLENPTVSDLVDAAPTVTSNAPTSFPLGDTIITYTATDDYGNSATTTQTITIQDTSSPTIVLPSDITAEATNLLTVLDIGTSSAIDNVYYTITNDAPTSFPLGTTIVTWSVSASSGITISDTQRITITDTTIPVFTTLLASESVNTAESSILIDYTIPTATDIFDTSVVCDPAPNTLFSIGDTIVTCTATDNNSNSAQISAVFTVTQSKSASITRVYDGTNFIPFEDGISITNNIPKFQGTSSGISSIQVMINDIQVGGNNIRDNGSFSKGWKNTPLEDGTYLLTINENGVQLFSSSFVIDSDGDGNIIADIINPTLTIPANKTFEATARLTPLSISQIGIATATDDATTNPAIMNNSTGIFKLGENFILYTATDDSENQSTDIQRITIQDTTNPVIEPINDITIESRGSVTVNFEIVSTDIFNVIVTCDPASDSLFDIGTTLITCTAIDTSNNQSEISFNVLVNPLPDDIPSFRAVQGYANYELFWDNPNTCIVEYRSNDDNYASLTNSTNNRYTHLSSFSAADTHEYRLTCENDVSYSDVLPFYPPNQRTTSFNATSGNNFGILHPGQISDEVQITFSINGTTAVQLRLGLTNWTDSDDNIIVTVNNTKYSLIQNTPFSSMTSYSITPQFVTWLLPDEPVTIYYKLLLKLEDSRFKGGITSTFIVNITDPNDVSGSAGIISSNVISAIVENDGFATGN